jgi:hypothetical protein
MGNGTAKRHRITDSGWGTELMPENFDCAFRRAIGVDESCTGWPNPLPDFEVPGSHNLPTHSDEPQVAGELQA